MCLLNAYSCSFDLLTSLQPSTRSENGVKTASPENKRKNLRTVMFIIL